MTKIKCFVKKRRCLRGGAISPAPRCPHVGQSKAAIDQVGYVLPIWRMEPADLAKNKCIQCRPGVERGCCRTQRLQGFSHEFLNIGFPCRNANYYCRAIERCKSKLPARIASAQLGVDRVEFHCILEELIQMQR